MEKVSPLDHIAGMVGSAIQRPWFGQMYSGHGWVSYTVAMVWSGIQQPWLVQQCSSHGWVSHAVAMVGSAIKQPWLVWFYSGCIDIGYRSHYM